MADAQAATIDALAATGAAVATKATYVGAGFAAVVAWWDSLPLGVVAGLGIAALGYLTGLVFRWLHHRREGRYRQLEHEAYMRRLAERDTAGAPLS